jgi:hypothetical protein
MHVPAREGEGGEGWVDGEVEGDGWTWEREMEGGRGGKRDHACLRAMRACAPGHVCVDL